MSQSPPTLASNESRNSPMLAAPMLARHVSLCILLGLASTAQAQDACGDIDAWSAYSGDAPAVEAANCATPYIPPVPPSRPAQRAPTQAVAVAAPASAPLLVASNETRQTVVSTPLGAIPGTSQASLTELAVEGSQPAKGGAATAPTTKSTPVATAPANPPVATAKPLVAPAIVAAPKPINTPALPTPAPVIVKPKEVWNAKVGMRLSGVVAEWAARAKWTVDWQSPDLDYRIDYPLHFEGTFQEAISGLVALYEDAERPIMANGTTATNQLKVCEFKKNSFRDTHECK